MKYTVHCMRTISESIEIEADSLPEALEAFEQREDENDLCHSCSGNDFAGDDFSRALDGELIIQRIEDGNGNVVLDKERS
jgi:hypothetical protein